MKNFTPFALKVGLMLLAIVPSVMSQSKSTAAIIITNTPTSGEGRVRANAPYLSAGISDIVKMHQAGVEEPVLLAFIQSSTVAYHPSAREVIYLREIGLPQSLLTAMLKRGGELRD